MSYGAEDTGWIEDPNYELRGEIAREQVFTALNALTGAEDFYHGKGKDWQTIYCPTLDGSGYMALHGQVIELVAQRCGYATHYVQDMIIDYLATEEVPE